MKNIPLWQEHFIAMQIYEGVFLSHSTKNVAWGRFIYRLSDILAYCRVRRS